MKITPLALAGVLTAVAVAVAAQPPAFEVASVKPGNGDGIREFQIQPGGRLVIHGMSVKDLVRRAYIASDAVQDENRITGGPSWVASDTFDVLAKADGDLGVDGLGRPMRLLAMLKTLLEVRFKVKVHAEVRDTPIYDLVLMNRDARLGPGLRASTIDCPVFTQGMPRPAPDPVRWCGVRAIATATGTSAVVHITAQGVTMAEIATNFSGVRSIARPVRDKTGLPGRFDFQFDYAAQAANPAEESGPSVFTVIQEQLGLKLQPLRGPVEFFVIDHAERPTDN